MVSCVSKPERPHFIWPVMHTSVSTLYVVLLNLKILVPHNPSLFFFFLSNSEVMALLKSLNTLLFAVDVDPSLTSTASFAGGELG